MLGTRYPQVFNWGPGSEVCYGFRVPDFMDPGYLIILSARSDMLGIGLGSCDLDIYGISTVVPLYLIYGISHTST